MSADEKRAGSGAAGKKGQDPAQKTKPASEFIRPENEDDDGYDPYSDRRSEPPLFERDPWD
ncbi:MAG: hypothetical protein SOV74_04100 [Coriobacteriales bacterium]|nr:hypothetical protein [Coriobacteriales bacterium]